MKNHSCLTLASHLREKTHPGVLLVTTRKVKKEESAVQR